VGPGAAIAIGVGALALVLLINRQREAQTAMKIAATQAQTYKPGGALSFMDAFNAGGTFVSYFYGGEAAGSAFVKGIK